MLEDKNETQVFKNFSKCQVCQHLSGMHVNMNTCVCVCTQAWAWARAQIVYTFTWIIHLSQYHWICKESYNLHSSLTIHVLHFRHITKESVWTTKNKREISLNEFFSKIKNEYWQNRESSKNNILLFFMLSNKDVIVSATPMEKLDFLINDFN